MTKPSFLHRVGRTGGRIKRQPFINGQMVWTCVSFFREPILPSARLSFLLPLILLLFPIWSLASTMGSMYFALPWDPFTLLIHGIHVLCSSMGSMHFSFCSRGSLRKEEGGYLSDILVYILRTLKTEEDGAGCCWDRRLEVYYQQWLFVFILSTA